MIITSIILGIVLIIALIARLLQRHRIHVKEERIVQFTAARWNANRNFHAPKSDQASVKKAATF